MMPHIFHSDKGFLLQNLSGMAARNCYSDQLYDLLYQFFRALKLGSRKAWDVLRGNGISADTNKGVSHLNIAGELSGALIIPEYRTMEKIYYTKKAESNAYVMVGRRFDGIVALFKKKLEYTWKHKHAQLCGIHTDETDTGEKGVEARMVKGRYVINGAINCGGLEEELERWV
ncbi:UNVERIFIED_CONTAM: hypothetical protein HDU68_004764 [Siphonaria sp. JEL0065]|nr:hypothetical protein HDU68_004764 [Siphonaria sp. JEL0065]